MSSSSSSGGGGGGSSSSSSSSSSETCVLACHSAAFTSASMEGRSWGQFQHGLPLHHAGDSGGRGRGIFAAADDDDDDDAAAAAADAALT